MALQLVVTWLLGRSASALVVVCCTLTLYIFHLLSPPSPLSSTHTFHPHLYPLKLYVPLVVVCVFKTFMLCYVMLCLPARFGAGPSSPGPPQNK